METHRHMKRRPETADFVPRARDVIDLEIRGLARVRDGLGECFNAAVRTMLAALDAGGKIVVTGVGKNLPIGEKISATLASTGATSVFLNPVQAMHGDLGILAQGDVLLALSYSGESEELLALLPIVRRLGVCVIALTGQTESAVARCSDRIVPVSVDNEACPFNLAPTVSTTATLALGDALAMVLLEARGFGKEDYARLHPAGAIGRALLLRVSDIMRTADRLAVVPAGATVKDAVLAMTRARSGSVGVVDAEQRLLGIFTDGDLRRLVTLNESPIHTRVDEVMTPSPIAVAPDTLAVDVLRIYERHAVDDLLVVDAQNRLIGAVDIQDLPRFKIL